MRQAADALAELERGTDYSTVQTIAGRLEKKGALRRTRKIGNAWLFEATIERRQVVGGLIDEILNLLGGASSPIVSHLVETEKLCEEDLEEIREMIAEREKRASPEEKGGCDD